jgi:hypothetical protein
MSTNPTLGRVRYSAPPPDPWEGGTVFLPSDPWEEGYSRIERMKESNGMVIAPRRDDEG